VDFDNDGYLDLFVVHGHTEDNIEPHATVVAGDLRQLAEVHSGRGYQSHWGSRLHFGLGLREKVNRIEVRWIGGGAEIHENIQADRLITITEGGTSR
jgi:hypothetical protein